MNFLHLFGGVVPLSCGWTARSLCSSVGHFLPCYLFTIFPAPYFKKYGKHPAIRAFVDGVTAAAIGTIAGAVVVLARRQLTDAVSFSLALITILVLLKFKKLRDPSL